MIKIDTSVWSQEKLAGMDKPAIQGLRANAERHGAVDVVLRCDEELARRAPSKAPKQKTARTQTEGDFVSEYHFVCQQDRGVSPGEKGFFWSRSWVVSEARVKKSIKYGGLLALHETKADASYRHGEIVDYRIASRDLIAKKNNGIEFLVRATSTPLVWAGTGSGEKGYLWAKVSGKPPDGSKTGSAS